jgi:hypothetical protein
MLEHWLGANLVPLQFLTEGASHLALGKTSIDSLYAQFQSTFSSTLEGEGLVKEVSCETTPAHAATLDMGLEGQTTLHLTHHQNPHADGCIQHWHVHWTRSLLPHTAQDIFKLDEGHPMKDYLYSTLDASHFKCTLDVYVKQVWRVVPAYAISQSRTACPVKLC